MLSLVSFLLEIFSEESSSGRESVTTVISNSSSETIKLSEKHSSSETLRFSEGDRNALQTLTASGLVAAALASGDVNSVREALRKKGA